MPIHDWTNVIPDVFHDFHGCWVNELHKVLNGGSLPSNVYAMAEQTSDALPSRQSMMEDSEADLYAKKANRVAIRHASGDRIVAIIEIVSPGNKGSRHGMDELLDKVWSIIDQDIHLLLIDLFPPTTRDPQGIHTLIWGDSATPPPADQPLTLAAYHAVMPLCAYVEPTSVGSILIDMPLFLDTAHYVPTPLEATYQAAWRGVPQRWKAVLEVAGK